MRLGGCTVDVEITRDLSVLLEIPQELFRIAVEVRYWFTRHKRQDFHIPIHALSPTVCVSPRPRPHPRRTYLIQLPVLTSDIGNRDAPTGGTNRARTPIRGKPNHDFNGI